MGEQNTHPVRFAGKMSFRHTGLIDVGALEGRENTMALVKNIQVVKGLYEAYYGIREDGKGVGAIMLVSSTYEGDVLVTDEKIGEFTVGLSNVVGFFSSPKKEYSLNQLGEYLKQLEKEHGKVPVWTSLNSKQFLAPSGQMAASTVYIYGHRNDAGEIDALQLEFNRKESAILKKGAKKAGKEVK